jgi:hypothetical protein
VNQLSKVIIAATMIGSFSLLWLMGDLQRKISSLEGQLNPQQPTYSPSVSEPSPSPTSTPTITIEPTPNLSNPNTGVVESDISGCWVRTFFSDQDQSSFYQKITYKLELGGSYTGEWFQEIITTLTGTSSSGPHTLSGKWIIDDGYVVIQEGDKDIKLTLKVISKHELIQVGGDYPAFTRC